MCYSVALESAGRVSGRNENCKNIWFRNIHGQITKGGENGEMKTVVYAKTDGKIRFFFITELK